MESVCPVVLGSSWRLLERPVVTSIENPELTLAGSCLPHTYAQSNLCVLVSSCVLSALRCPVSVSVLSCWLLLP